MHHQKNTRTVSNIIAIITLTLILALIPFLFSCISKTDITNETASETQNTEELNIFDAREISVGDNIGGLIVEEVNIEPGVDPNNKDSYFAIVKFSGKLEISGKYISYSDQPLFGRSTIFYPDDNSKRLIPRLKQDAGGQDEFVFENYEKAAELPKLSHDTRYVWFVFENTDKALDTFKTQGNEGLATIIIDNYIINYAPTDVYNTAILTELLARG